MSSSPSGSISSLPDLTPHAIPLSAGTLRSGEELGLGCRLSPTLEESPSAVHPSSGSGPTIPSTIHHGLALSGRNDSRDTGLFRAVSVPSHLTGEFPRPPFPVFGSSDFQLNAGFFGLSVDAPLTERSHSEFRFRMSTEPPCYYDIAALVEPPSSGTSSVGCSCAPSGDRCSHLSPGDGAALIPLKLPLFRNL